MAIGKRLCDLLEARKENVNSISSQISVSPQTIYSIIKRDNMKVDFDVLMRLAKALNVSVEYFYEPSLGEAQSFTIPNGIQITASERPNTDLHNKLDKLDGDDLKIINGTIDTMLTAAKYEIAAQQNLA